MLVMSSSLVPLTNQCLQCVASPPRGACSSHLKMVSGEGSREVVNVHQGSPPQHRNHIPLGNDRSHRLRPLLLLLLLFLLFHGLLPSQEHGQRELRNGTALGRSRAIHSVEAVAALHAATSGKQPQAAPQSSNWGSGKRARPPHTSQQPLEQEEQAHLATTAGAVGGEPHPGRTSQYPLEQ